MSILVHVQIYFRSINHHLCIKNYKKQFAKKKYYSHRHIKYRLQWETRWKLKFSFIQLLLFPNVPIYNVLKFTNHAVTNYLKIPINTV